MPAPKIETNATETNALKIIDFSRTGSDASKDGTPSQPPWTTFTGILEARRDSPVGKRILAMDPNAIDGETASEDQLKKMHKRPEAEKKNWVRGLWIAPKDWKEIPEF